MLLLGFKTLSKEIVYNIGPMDLGQNNICNNTNQKQKRMILEKINSILCFLISVCRILYHPGRARKQKDNFPLPSNSKYNDVYVTWEMSNILSQFWPIIKIKDILKIKV